MKTPKQLIRFDWAMKKMLRDKANFDILEGFLSELLSEEITINSILESESNKSTEEEKLNRVDILVKNSKGELVIIEVQNTQEYDYLHRILFGTSKAIIDHIKEGEPYASVKKIISITIAYFDLAQGADYIYHGTTSFKGIHKGDILNLGKRQKELYGKERVADIFPEYWLIKVSKFKNQVNDAIDQWVYFLKNGTIKDSFSAKGLDAAKKKLDKMNLTHEQEIEYQAYLKFLHDKASEQHTKMADAQEMADKAVDKALREKEIEIVVELWKNGVSVDIIAKSTNLTAKQVQKIIDKHQR